MFTHISSRPARLRGGACAFAGLLATGLGLGLFAAPAEAASIRFDYQGQVMRCFITEPSPYETTCSPGDTAEGKQGFLVIDEELMPIRTFSGATLTFATRSDDRHDGGTVTRSTLTVTSATGVMQEWSRLTNGWRRDDDFLFAGLTDLSYSALFNHYGSPAYLRLTFDWSGQIIDWRGGTAGGGEWTSYLTTSEHDGLGAGLASDGPGVWTRTLLDGQTPIPVPLPAAAPLLALALGGLGLAARRTRRRNRG